MDTYVENTGAAEQEKQIQVVPMENENQIHGNIQGEELAQNINIVRAENPDPLGRKTTNLPVNKSKLGTVMRSGRAERSVDRQR